jgi:hypothetical protein
MASSCALGCILVAVSVPIGIGCATHQCDPSSYVFCPAQCASNPGANPVLCPANCVPGGDVIDENTYETNPIAGPWLPYPHMVTIQVIFPEQFQQRIPFEIDPYVGVSSDADPDPNGPGNNWVVASGQLALLFFAGPASGAGPGGFSVNNGTCADYAARFVVHFLPEGSDAGASGVSPTVTDGAAAD